MIIIDIWRFGSNSQDKNNHLILTGDFIHSCYQIDSSLEIIDSVKNHFENEKNFHVLLGNHGNEIILLENRFIKDFQIKHRIL